MNLANANVSENEFGEAETNDLVIRSYTTIGSLNALGKVEVEARESAIPDRNHVAYFVKVSVESNGDYPQSGVALVNYDNLPKLLASLDKLAAIAIRTDRFSFSEIEYDVDGLKIIVFNDARGKAMFVIIAAGVSAHFNPLSRLEEFKSLITRAKQHLDRNKVEL